MDSNNYKKQLKKEKAELENLISEMKDAGVLEKAALVYGQMNEPPGARARVALTALTCAESSSISKGFPIRIFPT